MKDKCSVVVMMRRRGCFFAFALAASLAGFVGLALNFFFPGVILVTLERKFFSSPFIFFPVERQISGKQCGVRARATVSSRGAPP